MAEEQQYLKAVHSMEIGDESAKTTVAFHKLSGIGCEFDADFAVSLLEERAKDKDSEAQWMLGLCYEYGIGTEQDMDQALTLYRRSIRAKNPIGRFIMQNGKNRRGGGALKIDKGLLSLSLSFYGVKNIQ